MKSIFVKRGISLMLALVLAIILFTPNLSYARDNKEMESGVISDTVRWECSDGMLIITGSGEIPDYQDKQSAPWALVEFYNVKIGEGITSIGSNAFACRWIDDVYIPKSVLEIDSTAFDGVSYVYVELGSYAEQFAKDAGYAVAYEGEFNNLSYKVKDGDLIISGTGEIPDFNDEAAPWEKYDYVGVTIKEGITAIGDNAFQKKYLGSLDLPRSVISISEKHSFDKFFIEVRGYKDSYAETWAKENEFRFLAVEEDDSNIYWKIEDETLIIGGKGPMINYAPNKAPWATRDFTNVVIEEGITYIGDNAFYNKEIYWLLVSNSVNGIGETGIRPDITIISGEEGAYAEAWAKENGFTFEVYAEGEVNSGVYWRLNGSTLTIYGEGIIPNYSNGSTQWRDYYITDVVIEEGISSIGKEAFIDNEEISSVSIASSITEIADNSFNINENLCVSCRANTYAAKWAEQNACKYIIDDIIDDNITWMYDSESRCLSIFAYEEAELPDYELGKAPWSSLNIEKIDLENALISKIGAYAFANLNIQSILIPDSVKTINEFAFAYCDKLTSVYVNKAQEIVDNAFTGCEKLTLYSVGNEYVKQYAEANEIQINYISEEKISEYMKKVFPSDEKTLVLADPHEMKKLDELCGSGYVKNQQEFSLENSLAYMLSKDVEKELPVDIVISNQEFHRTDDKVDKISIEANAVALDETGNIWYISEDEYSINVNIEYEKPNDKIVNELVNIYKKYGDNELGDGASLVANVSLSDVLNIVKKEGVKEIDSEGILDASNINSEESLKILYGMDQLFSEGISIDFGMSEGAGGPYAFSKTIGIYNEDVFYYLGELYIQELNEIYIGSDGNVEEIIEEKCNSLIEGKNWNVEVSKYIDKSNEVVETYYKELLEKEGFSDHIEDIYYVTLKDELNNKLASAACLAIKGDGGRWEVIGNDKYYYDENGNRVYGEREIDGEWYFFDEKSGAMVRGWKVTDKGKCYYDKDGHKLFGLQKIEKEVYYFEETNGIMQSGWQTIMGERYYFTDEGYAVTGWYEQEEKYYYFDRDGVMQTGWQTIDESQYYFGEDGVKRTGWQTIDGEWYFFDENGKLVNDIELDGWYEEDGRRYYYKDGIMQTGWQIIDGKKYFFVPEGYVLTGWYSFGNTHYYGNKDGAVQTGWQIIDGEKYFFMPDGHVLTGWYSFGGTYYYGGERGKVLVGLQRIDGKIYFFSKEGIRHESCWQTVEDNRYYFMPDGHAITGWYKFGSQYYYSDGNGIMQTGWQTINEVQYYFGEDGVRRTGKQIIDGKEYVFDSQGKLIS